MARSIRTDLENNGKVDFLSKPLLRTNPKLSSNVKLVVCEDGLFLESFNADPKIAGSSYKRYRLKPEGSFSYDIHKFWSGNKTPEDLIYKVKRDYSDFSILDTYDKQFEETYNYGTSINYSKLYSEQFRLHAPIWLDKNVPSKFIIYRVDEAKRSYFGKKFKRSKINDDLSKATLIKTFDLSEDSDLGKYIRNHVNSEEFPTSPLKVSFDKDEKTLYNGIDLIKGGFVSKGEYHYKDTVNTDKPLIEYNDFITEGFSRNSMVCANLINLEFLFEDEEATEFSISRYFGIFVDEHGVGSGVVENINDDTIKFSEISHSLDLGANPDWYSLPYSKFFKEKPILGWAKSADNYHNIKNGSSWSSNQYEFKINHNNQDYSSFLGKKKTGKTIDVIKNEISEPDFLKIDVVDIPNNGDRFSVVNLKRQRFNIESVKSNTVAGGSYQIKDDLGNIGVFTMGTNPFDDLSDIVNNWPNVGTFAKYTPFLKEKNGEWMVELIENEINMEQSHKFIPDNGIPGTPTPTLISIKQTFTPIDVINHMFYADNTITRGKTDGLNFSNQGNLENIAHSISEVIRLNTRFETLVEKTCIYIKAPVKGYNRLDDAFFMQNQNNPFLSFGTPSDVNNLLNIAAPWLTQYNAYAFGGGANKNQSLYIIEDDEDQFNVGDYLLDSKNKFNKIIDIVEDSRTIGSEYKKIILEQKNGGIDKMVNIYSEFRVEWGYFDAYDIYDLNFDFYDNQNSNIKELYYELPRHDYNSIVTYLDTWYPGYIPSGVTAGTSAYSDVESLEKMPNDYFANLIPLLKGEEDLISLGASITEESIDSEYDRLQENNTTQFSTVSRVVPYINKWVLKDSLNVRENPYYLNVSESFGETNFAPDFSKEERDENSMTHEWFYLDKIPTYIEGRTWANSSFSYVNPALDIQIEFDDFKSISHDYFKSYFLSYGMYTHPDIKSSFADTNLRRKYTHFSEGDSRTFSSTIFNGIKFTPKLRKKQTQDVTKEFITSGEFNGYRFSTVVSTKLDSTLSNDLSYKVIQNKKFKYVVLFLELSLSDSNFEWLNRKILYELDHKLDQFGGYADTNLSGALDLLNSNLPTSSSGQTAINGITHSNGSSPQFMSQLLKDPVTGLFGKISVVISGVTYELQVVSIINNGSFLVSGGLYNPAVGAYQPVSFFTQNEIENAIYNYENGGVFAHNALLNRLCIQNVANVLNNTDEVEYTTIEEDGTEVYNKFALSVDNGNEVIKTSSLTVNVDTNKPKAFGLSNKIIGYNIEPRSFKYYSMLDRQNGNYTVDMKPVITFRDLFSVHKITPKNGSFSNEFVPSQLGDTMGSHFDYNSQEEITISEALYKKLNYCRVQFNLGRIADDLMEPADIDWGIIKNHWFHKVNEIDSQGVIKLSELDALPPKYNLIGEIAIGKFDKDVFKSRWEDEFYVRSEGAGKNQKVPGTKNIIEERNYASSSIMKVEKGYDIFNFTSKKYKTIEELNEIKESGNFENEINYIDNDKQIILDVDLTSSATRLLDGLGVRDTINKYVSPVDSFGRVETLDDDIDFYIRENILPMYTLSKIDLYVLPSKKVATEVDTVISLGGISVGGYQIDNNYTYKVDSKNPLNFRLIYNKKKGFNYKVRPLIKIQS